MDPLATVAFMQRLREREEPSRSKKTNWGKTLAVVLLTTLATAGVAYIVARLAALASIGPVTALLGRQSYKSSMPRIWHVFPAGPVGYLGYKFGEALRKVFITGQ